MNDVSMPWFTSSCLTFPKGQQTNPNTQLELGKTVFISKCSKTANDICQKCDAFTQETSNKTIRKYFHQICVD